MLAELIGLLLLIRVSVYLHKRTLVFTTITVFLILLSSILIYVEDWTSTFETLSIWRPILTAIIYSIQPVILIIIMYLTSPMRRELLLLLILPLAICVPIFATSQLTHLVFYYYENNRYAGGEWSYLPYILSGFYLLVLLVRNFVYFKNFPTRDKICIVYIVLTAVGCVVLYVIRDISSDYSAVYAYAIFMYYLLLYIDMAKIDTLTGLMNRQCYYRDIDHSEGRITGVVSVDMNELKYLNDTFGHEAGDKALVTIAKCLSQNSGSQKRVYRVGGDEFMIFYFRASEEFILKDIEKIRKSLSETEYVCAFGYAPINHNGSLEDEILLADKAMYEDKAKLKKAVLERGGKLHRRSDDL